MLYDRINKEIFWGGEAVNIIQKEHGLVYELRGITTRILAVGEGVIRVTHTRRPDFLERQSAVVVQHDSVPCRVTVDEQTCRLVSGVITVSVDQSSGSIVIRDADGRILLQEPKIRPHQLMEKPVYRYLYQEDAGVETTMSVDGVRASVEASERYLDRMAYECRQNFVFDANEALYGLGSHEEGIGNLRGHTRILYQQNMKAVVPMLVSTKGWGILFDMGSLMSFHDDVHGSYFWAAYADELDWYFLYGDGEYASLMERYRWLTGVTPMLPKYALGYIQSKERYVDAEEILSVAKEYRDRGVPLDVMVLDWQSWPANQWGYKTFDTTRFPDPKAFIQALHDMNVHFMISIWPSMNGDENQDRDAMLAQHGMLGNKTIYNAFDPDARALYWQQARDGLFQHGVDAWWCDCSEPFEADWRGEIKPEPFERVRINLQEAEKIHRSGNDAALQPVSFQWIVRGAAQRYRGEACIQPDPFVLCGTASLWHCDMER